MRLGEISGCHLVYPSAARQDQFARSISHQLFPDKYISNLFLKPSKDRTDLRVSLDNLSYGLILLLLLHFSLLGKLHLPCSNLNL